MRISPAAVKAAAALCLPLILAQPLWAEAPLSAIDWLSNSLSDGPRLPPAEEPAISQDGALPEAVSVSVLGGPSANSVGLLAPGVTGFPAALWGMGRSEEITRAVATSRVDGLPELQGVLLTLLLAEAEAPLADQSDGTVLLTARIDKLLEMGALEQASALLDAVGVVGSADLFRRTFDVALLTGNEDRACATMRAAPGLAPSITARVFCLARAGDWNAAALTLRTAQALGQVTDEEEQLLARFLDPDLFEGLEAPPPPKPVTPLILRIYAAVGEPLSTTTLPLAFAQADLDDRAGWKAQIEAAERLVRAGAISPNLLLGLYTERPPAASGGVWDRADAFQRFDGALSMGDAAAVAEFLPPAYARMREMELEVPFATLFASALARLDLPGEAGDLAFEIGLLSLNFETVARSATPDPADIRATFLTGLAMGSVKGLVPPDSMARAIAPAFQQQVLSEEFQPLLDQGRVGEAILLAMAKINDGLQGDINEVTAGLALLRHLGLEDAARRTALELMLLERRG